MVANKKKKISELFNFLPKSKIKAGEGLENGKYPFYTCSNELTKYYDEYTFEPNKLIFGTGGSASLHYASEPFATSTDCYVIEAKELNVDVKYVYYYLKNNFQILEDGFKGAGLKHISKDYLSNIMIEYPDIEEQQRIVNILDKAEEIRTKKKLANEKLDEFIDATFYYRFGNPEANEHSWDIVKLENVCNKITDGVHSKPAYTNIGIPFISVKDITTKKLLFEDCKFISEDDHYKYIKRCNPEYNDILYTKVGATYGRAAIVDTTKPFSLYVSVALLKPKKELINPLFLKAVLNTKYVKTQADKRIKGIGVPDLHLIEIKNFAIPLPPFEQQKQFAQIVQKVEAQKEKNQKVIEQMDNLFNSLMQQAFNSK